MQNAIKNYEDVDSYKTIMFLYQSALKEVGTKLEILNDEFHHVHKYNPIEHIKTRVKSPESIVKKLRRYGYEISIENMVKYVNDIAGIRVICSFTSDIYSIAEMIGKKSLRSRQFRQNVTQKLILMHKITKILMVTNWKNM